MTTTTETTLADKINALTLADARAWRDTSEKWMFCTDVLEISAERRDAEAWVKRMENHCASMLGRHASLTVVRDRQQAIVDLFESSITKLLAALKDVGGSDVRLNIELDRLHEQKAEHEAKLDDIDETIADEFPVRPGKPFLA